MVKDLLRKELRAQRDAIPAPERAAYGAALVDIIRSMPEFAAASVVLIYHPIGSEPDLLPLAEYAEREGKTVAFPAIRRGEMTFRVRGAASGFAPGAMGIPEPTGEELVRAAETPDALCVAPALAVDKRGYRIGYGGGYYDRFLSGFAGSSVCAVYPRFFVDSLPTEAHDAPVGAAAVAGEGIIRFR